MLLNCPECGQQVSNRAGTCPHCGYPLQNFGREETAEENQPEKNSGCLVHLIGFVSCALLCLIVISGGLFLALKSDAGGITTYLRRVAMTDAGDGSHGDTSEARIAVKYYMLQVLNMITGESVEDKPSVPVSELPQKITKPEPEIKPAEKTETAQMPPPPELPGK